MDEEPKQPLTASNMVAAAKERVTNLSPEQVAEALENEDVLLVDLREPDEIARDGQIAGSAHAPRGMLEFWADPSSSMHRPEFEPDRPTILY